MRFVVFDVETTGLVPTRDRIAWLAVAVVENGVVTSRASHLLDTGLTVNMTPADLEPSRLEFADIADDFLALLEGSIVVAHNARFDLAFLAAELGRLDRPMPTVESVCTMRLTQRLGVQVGSLSLVDCCAAFQILHQRRHRVDEDVDSTVQLLLRLLPLANQQGWRTAEPRSTDETRA